MAYVDPILVDLQQKYKLLEGMEFSGTYQGAFPMPQTGNQRDVILISPLDPFATTLGGISSYVLKTYGLNVWKGITGPEDIPPNPAYRRYTDYWLWVELGCGLSNINKFKITQCTAFPCGDGTFTHGVSIKAIAI